MPERSLEAGERRAPLPLLVAVTMTGTVALHIFVPALAAAAADLGTTAAGAQLIIHQTGKVAWVQRVPNLKTMAAEAQGF